MVAPILEYKNCTAMPDGCLGISVTGGYVYRGSHADWDGKYIFGDWSKSFAAMDGQLFMATKGSDGTWTMEAVNVANMEGQLPYILAFAQDAEGEVYALTSVTTGPSRRARQDLQDRAGPIARVHGRKGCGAVCPACGGSSGPFGPRPSEPCAGLRPRLSERDCCSAGFDLWSWCCRSSECWRCSATALARADETGLTEAFMNDPANIELGQELFQQQCAKCHGKGAYPGKAPKLKAKKLSPEDIYLRITYGYRPHAGLGGRVHRRRAHGDHRLHEEPALLELAAGTFSG